MCLEFFIHFLLLLMSYFGRTQQNTHHNEQKKNRIIYVRLNGSRKAFVFPWRFVRIDKITFGLFSAPRFG